MIKEGTASTKPIPKGKKDFHITDINWSYLNLGNVALTQTKPNNKTVTLSPKAKPGKEKKLRAL